MAFGGGGGLKVAHGVKVANQLTLNWGDGPGSFRRASCIHKVLKTSRGRQRARVRG